MTEPGTGLGSTLVEEILRLHEVFGLRLLVWVTAVLLGTGAARSALAVAMRLAWRVGLDRERRLGRIVAVLRLLAWVGGALLSLHPVFVQVPVLTTAMVVLAVGLVALALPRLLQSLAVGLSIVLRGRYREGDQIQVQSHRGSIRLLGLARTQLRVDDGSVVWIPNAMLDAEAVKVERSTGAAPVRVQFSVEPAQRERVLERITRAATLSPFRRAGSRVRVSAVGEDERRYGVELQTWATRELDLVRRILHRIVDEALAGSDAPKERT